MTVKHCTVLVEIKLFYCTARAGTEEFQSHDSMVDQIIYHRYARKEIKKIVFVVAPMEEQHKPLQSVPSGAGFNAATLLEIF